MKEEVKRWWKQTLKDIDTAETLFKIKKYSDSSFFCQQASEKALKTLLLKKNFELIKVHDLVLLAKKVSAPEEIIKVCKKLAPVYVETRYPDTGEEGFREYSMSETKGDLESMDKIVKWVKEKL